MAFAQEMVAQGLAPGQAHAVTGASKMALVATGTVQADALSLPAALNSFATVAAGAGAILPSKSNAGDSITIFNGGANDLTVYPPAGGFLDGQSVNTPTTQVAATTAIYFCFAKNTWTSVQKSQTGTLTGTGAAGDLAVWSGASNIISNSAVAPATAVYIGTTPFAFLESSPGTVQLGDAGLTFTAATAILAIGGSASIDGINGILNLNGSTWDGLTLNTVTVKGAAGDLLLESNSGSAQVLLTDAGGAWQIGNATSSIACDSSNNVSLTAGLGQANFSADGTIDFIGPAGTWEFDKATGALFPNTPLDIGEVASPLGTGYFGTSVVIAPVAKASLPAAPIAGEKAIVNDALAPAFGVAVADMGAVTVPVFYNGANWIVG